MDVIKRCGLQHVWLILAQTINPTPVNKLVIVYNTLHIFQYNIVLV